MGGEGCGDISMLKFWPSCDFNWLDLWVACLGLIFKKKIRLEFLLFKPRYIIPLKLCRNMVHFKINYNYRDNIN